MNAKEKKKLKEKKNKLIKKIKTEMEKNQELDKYVIEDYTTQFFDISDFDKSGTIDWNEFKYCCEKIDEEQKLGEEKFLEVFNSKAEDGMLK